MTAAGNFPDSWEEVALIGIIPEGGSEIAFGALTDDISALEWGEKDFEGRPNISGGRIEKKKPQGDESITLKIVPLTAQVDGETTATGVAQLFNPQDAGDSTYPIVVKNTRNRIKFGLIILWAETLPATAGALPAESKTAYRIQVINARMTTYKLSYDDKSLTAEVTFKWSPFDKVGDDNKQEESTDGTAQLGTAISSATAFP